MQKWTRWQDWVALIAGAYGLLSPIWTDTETKATWTMVVLGAITVLASLWSLAMPADRVPEYAIAVLGVLFFISPWVMGFTAFSGLAAAAWVVGVITFIAGVWAVPAANRMHTAGAH